MLFNEPKLLKFAEVYVLPALDAGFSALQRAEIAEMLVIVDEAAFVKSFSALQRAEIAEIARRAVFVRPRRAFQCSSTSRNC